MLNIQSIDTTTASSLKLTIDRAALLKSLGHVQSVVERRNTIPILSNVKISAEENALKFTATDMDIAAADSIEAQVESLGEITAPAHMLHDIIRKLPDGSQVELMAEEDGSRLTINAGRASFSLPCLPVDDFPVMEEGDYSHQFELASAELAELIDNTRFAVSTEETRYYLNGIYLHAVEADGATMLRAVATDGHRLARMDIALPEGAAGMPGIIVPRKTVAELKKLVDGTDEAISIALSETKIRFGAGSVMLTSKLIDGTFPDYSRVIPEHNDRLMEVNAKQFAESVDRVSTIASDKTRAVKLSLDKGALTLMADSQDNADAQEVLEVSYAAEALEIGFNARYLMDVLQLVQGETAQFVLADGAAPALIRDTNNVGALFVIMPMRV